MIQHVVPSQQEQFRPEWGILKVSIEPCHLEEHGESKIPKLLLSYLFRLRFDKCSFSFTYVNTSSMYWRTEVVEEWEGMCFQIVK